MMLDDRFSCRLVDNLTLDNYFRCRRVDIFYSTDSLATLLCSDFGEIRYRRELLQ
jgi:hypothetical protein